MRCPKFFLLPAASFPLFLSFQLQTTHSHRSIIRQHLQLPGSCCFIPTPTIIVAVIFIIHFIITLYTTKQFQRWPNQEMKRREPRSSRPSARNAIPLNLEEHTSRVPTFTVSGDVNQDRLKDTPTRVPIRRVELCGERIPFLITWRTLRSTSR